jgi:hypothetical protein
LYSFLRERKKKLSDHPKNTFEDDTYVKLIDLWFVDEIVLINEKGIE